MEEIINDLISTAEAARILGYKARQTINYLIRTGKLKAVRMGSEPRGRWVLRRSEVEELRKMRQDEK